jgi:hypothetical protein
MYNVRKALQPIVPASDQQKRKTRHEAGFLWNRLSVMAVLVFVLVLVAAAGVRTSVVTQVVANRAARRATQPGADRRTG